MSLTSDQLWQRLLREGLATPEQCQQWTHELSSKLAQGEASNGLKLLLQLIAAGHLSKYQAKIIAGQASGPIRFGPWLVEQPVKSPLWQGWYIVRQGRVTIRWARPVSASELQLLRPLRPSLPRALKLATVQHDGLVTGPPPELIDGMLLLFLTCPPVAGHAAPSQATATQSLEAVQAVPVEGSLLGQEYAQRRCPPAEATRIISRLAEVLAELHGQHIVHGRVLPDRIFLQAERVVLLVDPLCAATGLPSMPKQSSGPAQLGNPAQLDNAIQLGNSAQASAAVAPSTSGLIGSAWQMPAASAFTAPELHLPDPIPSLASDVFSLGCVWWWLLTGQPPAASQSQLTAQSQPAPTLPDDSRLPEPLWRCLRACLAPNPSNRIASAEVLQQALAAAERARPIAVAVQAETLPAATSRSEVRQTSPGSSRQTAADNLSKTEQTVSVQQATESGKRRSRTLTTADIATPATGMTPAVPTAVTPFVTTAVRPAAAIPRRRRRRQGIPWLAAILGGCGLLIGLLVVLKLTGALQPGAETQQVSQRRSLPGDLPANPRGLGSNMGTPAASLPADPRGEHFEIVAASASASQRGLWAPPSPPDPLPLDLLPPGGQVFLSLRPDRWPTIDVPSESSVDTSGTPSAAWPGVLGAPIVSLAQQLSTMGGVPLADMAQVTLSFYSAEQSGQAPRVCGRFRLNRPLPQSELIAAWNHPAPEEVAAEQQLWVVNAQQAYYIAGQAQAGAETSAATISDFSVGPVDMMREVAELAGARGPLLPHLEKLWNSTDQTADVSLLVSTPFLSTDGRELLTYVPSRLSPALHAWLGGDIRGASMQLHWQPQWFFETRVVGTNDLEAGKILARQQQLVQTLPATVEQWLVEHAIHPYWRALALRYPQMLRSFVDYTRFGVENGAALMNGYLPTQGGTNLMLTSWIALQDFSVASASTNNLASGSVSAAGTNNTQPSSGAAPASIDTDLDIESYLSQPIKLSFDQEPIEVALQLVAEEANAKLASGVEPLRFMLDGAAFGKAGITRNQQLSNFRVEQQSVRDALTDIARRGNPVTTVTDLHQADQRLLWLVAADPDSPSGASMVLLTTRAAAKENGYELPSEFAPPP